jgi:hypothetical protein
MREKRFYNLKISHVGLNSRKCAPCDSLNMNTTCEVSRRVLDNHEKRVKCTLPSERWTCCIHHASPTRADSRVVRSCAFARLDEIPHCGSSQKNKKRELASSEPQKSILILLCSCSTCGSTFSALARGNTRCYLPYVPKQFVELRIFSAENYFVEALLAPGAC